MLWRRKQRRHLLVIAAAAILALLLVACVGHVDWRPWGAGSRQQEARPSLYRRRVRKAPTPRTIRSSQNVLPIMFSQLGSLKKTPLKDWGSHERTLLDMTFQPWISAVQGSSCKELKTAFSRDMPPTALISLPSSGNSWVRLLIEGATGVFTGSWYSDISMMQKGMYGEAVPVDSRVTIVQKTHGFTTLEGLNATRELQRADYSHVRQFDCRGILLVRNPLDAIVGHRHLDTGGHLGFAPPEQFRGERWRSFVQKKSELWEQLYRDWIEQCPPEQLLVISYEQLVDNLASELGRVLTYLKVKADPRRLQCLYTHPENKLRRSGRRRKAQQVVSEPYSEDQKTMVMQHANQLDQLIRDRGLGQLPEYKTR